MILNIYYNEFSFEELGIDVDCSLKCGHRILKQTEFNPNADKLNPKIQYNYQHLSLKGDELWSG